jgi:hypothetical protein
MTEAGMTEHDAVTRAIETSGLTVTEVADRAGLDAAQLDHFPMVRVPLAVLSRLADVEFSRYPRPAVPARDSATDKRPAHPLTPSLRIH